MSNETNNLDRVELGESQPNPHITINDSDGAVDAKVTARLSILISTTSPITLIANQNAGRAVFLVLAPDAAPPVAPFTINFPNLDLGLFYIVNTTSQTATLQKAGQSSPPTLAAAGAGLYIVSSAEGVKAVTGAGSGSTFIGQSDTPGTYAGQASKLLAVNSGATAIEFVTTIGIPIRFPAGTVVLPGIEIGEAGTGFSLSSAGVVSQSALTTEIGRRSITGIAIGAGFDPAERIDARSTGSTRIVLRGDIACNNRISLFTANSNPPVYQGIKGRGSQAAPTVPLLGDTLVQLTGQGYVSGSIPAETVGTGGRIGFDSLETTWSNTTRGTIFKLELCALGSATLVNSFTVDRTNGVRMDGANDVIDINRILRPRSYTKATLPTITTTGIIHCSDENGGACLLFSDGTNWRRGWDRGISGTQPRHTIGYPAVAMYAPTTAGAGAVDLALGTSPNEKMIKSWAFDPGATAESIQFTAKMPENWDGSTVSFRYGWYHPATTTNFGVVFNFAGVALNNDDAINVNFGTAVGVADTGGTTNDFYESDESAAVTIAGSPTGGSWVLFQLSRNTGSGSDTLAVDANIVWLEMFYGVTKGSDS